MHRLTLKNKGHNTQEFPQRSTKQNKDEGCENSGHAYEDISSRLEIQDSRLQASK